MKLNAKLGLLMVAASILGLVVFIALSLIISDIFSKGYAPRELNALGQQIAEDAERLHVSPAQMFDLLEQTVSDHPELDLHWVTPEGTIIYSTNGRTESYTFHEMTSKFIHTPDRFWMPGLDITFAFSWEKEHETQYIIMELPVEAMQASQVKLNIRDYSDSLALLLPLLLFLLTPYIVSFLFVLRMNHRLKMLTNAMNHIDAKKTVITIKDQSPDEIGQLTSHFNAMSERINEQVSEIQGFDRNKKTLIANLSHDLRTPMTKIQGYAETLYEELEDTATAEKKFVEIIIRQSQYMGRLLQKLLEISNLDTRKGNIELHTSNVTEHLRKISADFVSILERKKIAFDIQIPDQPIYALVDAYLFERAVRNLIENAIHYGSTGNYLGVSLEKDEHGVHVRITDHGPGIPEDQIMHIFERFYRGSAARNGEGMGIGLSIVREIAVAHHGMVDVHSAQNEKTIFTFTLPTSSTLPS